MAFVPDRPTVPCAGCETIRRASALRSGSAADNAMATGFGATVEAEAFDATGARFVVALSLPGPLWHM